MHAGTPHKEVMASVGSAWKEHKARMQAERATSAASPRPDQAQRASPDQVTEPDAAPVPCRLSGDLEGTSQEVSTAKAGTGSIVSSHKGGGASSGYSSGMSELVVLDDA